MSRLMPKPTKWSVRPAKTRISLGIRPVWTVFAMRSVGSWGPNCSSCGQRRLIRLGGCSGWSRVFPERKGHYVGFVMRRLKILGQEDLNWDSISVCQALSGHYRRQRTSMRVCIRSISIVINRTSTVINHRVVVIHRALARFISARPRSALYTIGICLETAKNTKAFEFFFTGFQRPLWKFSATGNLYSLKSWLWLAVVACVVRWPISNALLNDIWWLACFTRMCNWNSWHKHRVLLLR